MSARLALLLVVFLLKSTTCIKADSFGDVAMNSQNTVLIGNSSANGTIFLGYMMDQLKAPYRIGAIRLALENGQANGLLLGFNFRYVCHITVDQVTPKR